MPGPLLLITVELAIACGLGWLLFSGPTTAGERLWTRAAILLALAGAGMIAWDLLSRGRNPPRGPAP